MYGLIPTYFGALFNMLWMMHQVSDSNLRISNCISSAQSVCFFNNNKTEELYFNIVTDRYKLLKVIFSKQVYFGFFSFPNRQNHNLLGSIYIK